MATPLSITAVCNRGFDDPTSLTPQERLVYLLADLESLKDMEGWDHFFTSAHSMRFYPNLVEGLQAAGDSVTVEMLQAYERLLGDYGVPFAADAIAKFLSDSPEEFWKDSRDWESEFEHSKEERWRKVEDYLRQYGYKLVA